MIEIFKSAVTIGIDGCKGGWCCSFAQQEQIKTFGIEKIDQISALFPFAQNVMIDIPIGLESRTHKRDLDHFARQHLKPGYTSSVFTPPVRAALHATNYEETCEINFDISGRKISIQSWNISKKILEVDSFIRQNKLMKNIFHESHPEICFKYLNKNRSLTHSKHKRNRLGIEERLKVLSNYHEHIYTSFEKALSENNHLEVKADDIVDSMCLFVVGNLGVRYGFSMISGTSLKDENDIDLHLYYFDPENLNVPHTNH